MTLYLFRLKTYLTRMEKKYYPEIKEGCIVFSWCGEECKYA